MSITRAILYVLASPVAGLLALAAFVTWYTALIYLLVLASLVLLAVRFHERHHASDAFDDRLTDERMRLAREYLVKLYGGDKSECE
jgi:fatty acid desaturase